MVDLLISMGKLDWVETRRWRSGLQLVTIQTPATVTLLLYWLSIKQNLIDFAKNAFSASK